MNRDAQDQGVAFSVAALAALAAVATLAAGIASLVVGRAEFRWFAILAGTFLLAPAALILAVRALRGDLSGRRTREVLRRTQETLERDRAELTRREREVEGRATKVEDQWHTLRELVEARGGKRMGAARAAEVRSPVREIAPTAAAVTEDLASGRELAALRQEIRNRRESERLLAERNAELEAAKAEAEAKLRSVREKIRVRRTAVVEEPDAREGADQPPQGEREHAEERAARLAAEEKAAQEKAAHQAAEEERLAAERRSAALLAEAEETARLLVAEAEERARALRAQGEAEFEAALREIREKEEIERTIAERIAELEEARAAAEARLRGVQGERRASSDPA
jgi:hypothetical protein